MVEHAMRIGMPMDWPWGLMFQRTTRQAPEGAGAPPA